MAMALKFWRGMDFIEGQMDLKNPRDRLWEIFLVSYTTSFDSSASDGQLKSKPQLWVSLKCHRLSVTYVEWHILEQ